LSFFRAYLYKKYLFNMVESSGDAQKKFSTLKLRVVSALVAAVCIIGAYALFGKYGLIIAGSVAALLSQREIARMLLGIDKRYSNLFLFFSVSTYLMMVYLPNIALHIFVFGLLLSLLSSFVILRTEVSIERIYLVLNRIVVCHLYTVLLPFFAVGLIHFERGDRWFALLIITVFAGDISAYFGGSQFGKNKLWPTVSPKKTWEGAVAGLVGSVILGSLTYWYLLGKGSSYGISSHQGSLSDSSAPQSAAVETVRGLGTELDAVGASMGGDHLSLLVVLLFLIAASVSAQMGDFFESTIKRHVGVKDSGSLMPGHGGILDRIDGILFGAPIIYFLAMLS